MDPLIQLELGQRRLEELRADAAAVRSAHAIRSRRAPSIARARRAAGAKIISAGLRLAGDGRNADCILASGEG
jgi:hypothetical protein